MSLATFVVLVLIGQCSGAIYHLNDTEYHRMPPLTSLDAYDKCLHQVNGVYCLARYDLVADSQNDLITVIQEYSAHIKKHFNHTYVERGICVTKSCQKHITNEQLNVTEDLNMILETCVNASIFDRYGIQAKLTNVHYCDRHNEKLQTDLVDWVVATLISFLLIINFLGTFYDIFYYNKNLEEENSIAKKIIVIFSIPRNLELLLSGESTGPRMKRLEVIHSLKVITTFFVILAHAILINSTAFTDNPHDFEKFYENTYYQMIFNGMNTVQIFLIISGLMLGYRLQINTENPVIAWTTFSKILLLRWWRLSSVYAVVLALTATWLRHCGSGPLWKYNIVNSVSADCRKNWWLHLLYVNNYVNDNDMCVVHSWYLAADMQLFTIGLAAFIWARKYGKNTVLYLMFLIGIVAPMLHIWLLDLDGVLIMSPEFYRTIRSDSLLGLHVAGHNNLFSFFFGMLLGYFHKCQNLKRYRNLLSTKVSVIIALCIPAALIKIFLTGRVFYEDGERASLVVRMTYTAIVRVIIGGITAITIIGLIERFNDRASRFFEWNGWSIGSRLSYSVYLLHLNLIYVFLGTRHQLGHVSSFDMIIIHFAVLSMSYVIAVPFYLLVEAPMGRLIKCLMNANAGQPSVKKYT